MHGDGFAEGEKNRVWWSLRPKKKKTLMWFVYMHQWRMPIPLSQPLEKDT